MGHRGAPAFAAACDEARRDASVEMGRVLRPQYSVISAVAHGRHKVYGTCCPLDMQYQNGREAYVLDTDVTARRSGGNSPCG